MPALWEPLSVQYRKYKREGKFEVQFSSAKQYQNQGAKTRIAVFASSSRHPQSFVALVSRKKKVESDPMLEGRH